MAKALASIPVKAGNAPAFGPAPAEAFPFNLLGARDIQEPVDIAS